MVFAGDLDKLVFTPAANFNGNASFSYTASDGNLASAAATVTLTITPTTQQTDATYGIGGYV